MSKTSQLKKKEKNKPKKDYFNISEEELVMEMLIGNITWKEISVRNLSFEFISKYKDKLNWSILCTNKNFPKKYLKIFTEYVDWFCVCRYQTLTPTIIKTYDKYMHWDLVAMNGAITNEIFETYFENLYLSLHLPLVFKNPNIKLTCDVIEKYADYYDAVCWDKISGYKLTEEFIEKYKDNLYWDIICRYQDLSEDFILRNKSYIKWNKLPISRYKYSDKFIMNVILPNVTERYAIVNLIDNGTISEYMLNNINNPEIWKQISYNCNLSMEFIKKYKNKLYKTGLLNNMNLYLNRPEIERIMKNE